MGAGANVTRKRVVDLAEECLKRTNLCISDLSKLNASHNALANKTGADIEKIEQRVTGASAWCQRTENSLTNHMGAQALVDQELAAEIATLRSDLVWFGRHLTRWQRFRWLWTGKVPVNAIAAQERRDREAYAARFAKTTSPAPEKTVHRTDSVPSYSPNAAHRPIP